MGLWPLYCFALGVLGAGRKPLSSPRNAKIYHISEQNTLAKIIEGEIPHFFFFGGYLVIENK